MSPSSPYTQLIGLSALSDEERNELKRRFQLLLQQEANEINAVEERRRGIYVPLLNVSIAFVHNSFQYRLEGSCALGHRAMRWSNGLLDSALNLSMCSPRLVFPVEIGSGDDSLQIGSGDRSFFILSLLQCYCSFIVQLFLCC
jgi:hypothetical protein